MDLMDFSRNFSGSWILEESIRCVAKQHPLENSVYAPGYQGFQEQVSVPMSCSIQSFLLSNLDTERKRKSLQVSLLSQAS
jgi:hypothetical protein